MRLSEQTAGDILIVNIEGRFDINSAETLEKSFRRWLKANQNFVLNCKKLEFLDSTGLGTLLRFLKQTMKHDGDIRLAELNEAVRMVLEITRADHIFQIFPTTREAVSSYNEPNSSQVDHDTASPITQR